MSANRSLPSNQAFTSATLQHVLEDPVHKKYAENEANFRALDEASEADRRKQWAEMGYVPPPGTYFKHGTSMRWLSHSACGRTLPLVSNGWQSTSKRLCPSGVLLRLNMCSHAGHAYIPAEPAPAEQLAGDVVDTVCPRPAFHVQ